MTLFSKDTVYRFPAMMCRRDPVLARAPENFLFQLFVERRWRLPAWRRSLVLQLLLPLLFFGSALVLALVSPCVVLIGAWLGWKAFRWFRRTLLQPAASVSDAPRRVPGSVRQLLDFKNGVNKPVLLDLWLCGVTGDQLVEAYYMETRRRGIVASSLIIVLAAAASIAWYFAAAGMETVFDLFLPCGLLVFWSSLLCIGGFGTVKHATDRLNILRDFFISGKPPSGILDNLRLALVALLAVIAVSLVGAFTIEYTSPLLNLLFSPQQAHKTTAAIARGVVAAFVAAAGIAIFVRENSRVSLLGSGMIFAGFNGLFDDYIRRHVIGDADGRGGRD